MRSGSATRFLVPACTVAALCTAAWWPFAPGFEGPYLARNRAELTGSGALTVAEPSIVRADAPWLPAARTARHLQLDLVIEPASRELTGPARIFTLSRDTRAAHLMVGQEGTTLVVRCRRPGSGADGEPRLEVPGAFEAPGPRHVRVTVAGPKVAVAVDGSERAVAEGDADILPTWREDYSVAFGDEHTRSRAWRGTLHQAQLQLQTGTGAGDHNLLAATALELPARFWQIPERARRALRPERNESPWTKLGHVALFAPFGWSLTRYVLRPGRVTRTLLQVGLIAFAASLSLEFGKLAFSGRHPNLFHASFDVLGATLGAMLAAWIVRRR